MTLKSSWTERTAAVTKLTVKFTGRHKQGWIKRQENPIPVGSINITSAANTGGFFPLYLFFLSFPPSLYPREWVDSLLTNLTDFDKQFTLVSQVNTEPSEYTWGLGIFRKMASQAANKYQPENSWSIGPWYWVTALLERPFSSLVEDDRWDWEESSCRRKKTAMLFFFFFSVNQLIYLN